MGQSLLAQVGREMAAPPALPLPTQDLLETGTMIASEANLPLRGQVRSYSFPRLSLDF